MREKKFLALLFAASLAIKLPLALFFVRGFGVDETLYLSLARKFAETGEYGIATEFYDEHFVAPLWPIALSAFFKFGEEFAARLLSPIVSSLTVIAFYFLGKNSFDKKIGEYAALFFLFNPAAILLGTRLLTESLALLFFTLAVFFLFGSAKKKWMIVPFIAFAALAGLTRYPLLLHSVVIFVVFIFLARKLEIIRNKFFFLGIFVGILIMLPWFVFNFQTYTNIFGGALHQASSDAGFIFSQAVLYFPYLFIVLGPLFPFTFIGIKHQFDKKQIVLPGLFFVFFFTQFFILGKVAEERYLFPILPFAILLTGLGWHKISLKKMWSTSNYILAALLFIAFIGGIYLALLFGNFPRYIEMKQAVLWVKENCTSPVVSNGFTYVWYYAGFENLPLLDKEKTIELISKRDVKCIIFTPYEPFSENFLQNTKEFELVKSFGNVLIYKVKL
jgi:4-amino-4-deoxy-L-arabinose transferase-like glycosyltransferase